MANRFASAGQSNKPSRGAHSGRGRRHPEKFMAAWILLIFALPGCTTNPQRQTGPEPGSTRVVDCGDRAFHAALGEEQATLYLPGLALSLTRTDGESGQRYAGNGYQLHQQGQRASFQTPGQAWSNCRMHSDYNAWARAWLDGVRFRAVGHEPDWVMEIRPGRQLRLQRQDGDKQLTTRLSQAELGKDLVVYRGRTDSHRIRIEIVEHPCRASAGDSRHGHAVRLRLDNQAWHGCGRGLAPVEAAPTP